MKKLLIPVLFACMIILSSCGGETVKPTPTPSTTSKKISEIYYEYERHDYISNDNGQTWNEYQSYCEDKVLRERWTWDGDKILSIENYSELIYDNISYNFYYNEENLVSEIIAPDIDERVVFTYNNNQISTMEFYFNNVLSDTLELVYTDNTITQINSTVSPENVTITWNGNNISKLTYNVNNDEAEVLYTYDNKRNPYHDFDALLALALVKEGEMGIALMSTNNIISDSTQYLDPLVGNMVDDVHNYTYQYQDNYPTLRTEREENVHTDLEYMTKHISEKRYYINYLAD